MLQDSSHQDEKVKSSKSHHLDFQQYLDIPRFEKMMTLFKANENDRGESKVDQDKFRDIIHAVIGDVFPDEQLDLMFMRVNANSDGTLSWDDFSSYMMSMTRDGNLPVSNLIDEKSRSLQRTLHQEAIIYIDFIPRERRYITVSRDGLISLWHTDFSLQKLVDSKDFSPSEAWINAAKYLNKHNKLACTLDDRSICIYDILSIKPRLIVRISQMEFNPLCLTYSPASPEDQEIFLVGDDGGYLNVVCMELNFIADYTADPLDPANELTQAKLSKKTSLAYRNIWMWRMKLHSDWVLDVQYYPDMSSFITCSSDSESSMVIGHLDRHFTRSVGVLKGVRCFNVSRRPSFILTGGRDKVIKMWNPYIMAKPTATLVGHNCCVLSIMVNEEDSHIISISEDKMIKIWSSRTMVCLQTISEVLNVFSRLIPTAFFYDPRQRRAISAAKSIEFSPYMKTYGRSKDKSHELPIVGAKFNLNFNQVVSASMDGAIMVWDMETGDLVSQFDCIESPDLSTHVTTFSFDKSGRRLIVGTSDSTIKVYNFSNGQLLKVLHKKDHAETSRVDVVELHTVKFILAAGWDQVISVFPDEQDQLDVSPIRILDGCNKGSIHQGHRGDITAMAVSPFALVTSSADGVILVWNLESGFIKCVMKDPYIAIRGREEKPVEEIHFLPLPNQGVTAKSPLLTFHADGNVRVWNTQTGNLIYEFNTQIVTEESLCTASLNIEGTKMCIGGSDGHIRLMKIDNARFVDPTDEHDFNGVFGALRSWRGHINVITSIAIVDRENVIITASKDCTVRLWSFKGEFIGIFRKGSTWKLNDPTTFSKTVDDVTLLQDREAKLQAEESLRIQTLKKNVINIWRCFAKDYKNLVSEAKNNPMLEVTPVNLRNRIILSQICDIWKDFAKVRKEAEDWKVNDDLLSLQGTKKFFSLDKVNRRHPSSLQDSKNKNFEAVYQRIECHQLNELPSIQHPIRAKKSNGL